MSATTTKSSLKAVCLAALLCAVGTPSAVAATPEHGTISMQAPDVAWTGQVQESYLYYMFIRPATGSNAMCHPTAAGPGVCDQFKLTLADPGLLTLTADTDCTCKVATIALYVRHPDGVTERFEGQGGREHPLTVDFGYATEGEYIIDYADGIGGVTTYHASASLADPYPPRSPVAPAVAPSIPTESRREPALRIRTGKPSARRANRTRRLRMTLAVSRPFASVTARLLRGRREVGSAKLGETSGQAPLVFSLTRKLARGRYRVVVDATDFTGTRVTRAVPVRVER